jgi:sulfopyruvate decarboxylase TPP-binding subunit
MHARTDVSPDTMPAWPEDIFAILQRFDVRQVAYVPDAGHSRLIERVLSTPSMRAVALTTEEEGVALLAGAWAGGQHGVLLMQSSGVGNCINMFSLIKNCGFPCLILVTMRGEFGEFNPWQVPMGSITEANLKLASFLTYRIEAAEDMDDVVGAACDMAFGGNLMIAVLLSQRLIGRKDWTK